MSGSAIQTKDLAAGSSFSSAGSVPVAEQAFRFFCLTIALTLPALVCLCVAYVADPDIWWHIASGDWIRAHHAFPVVDTFSSSTAGHPWQAYSWLFEVSLTKLFGIFGLPGIVAYSTGMVLFLTAAFFFLVRSTQHTLRIAVPLTWAASFALLTLYSPRPWHFSILFFVVEIAVVQSVRRNGNTRLLFWLPVLFAVWANLHIQFIDGLSLLALVLLESIFVKISTRISVGTAFALLATCALATLFNPYGWNIYAVAHDLATQHGVTSTIEELKAMPFRAPSNFLVLFLTLAAGAALGRRNRFQFFETALLAATALLSFRSQRDIWLVVAASVAILAQGLASGDEGEEPVPTPSHILPACACAGLLLVGAAHLIKLSNQNLQPKLQSEMPVSAAAYVHDHRIPGPVFCDFVWGGYLIHALGQPVSIDGRAALHGDQQLERSAHTWAGYPDWATDPQLASAAVVVGRTSAALTQLLRTDSRFDRVYEDKLATVFVPHRTPTDPHPIH